MHTSLRKRTRAASPISGADRNLRATAWFRMRSSARYTSPIPPCPSKPRMRYRPASTVPAAKRPSSTLLDEDGGEPAKCSVFVSIPAPSAVRQAGHTLQPSRTSPEHFGQRGPPDGCIKLADRAVIRDQIQRRRCFVHRPQEAGDLPAVMRPVIHQVQKNLPYRLRVGASLHILVFDHPQRVVILEIAQP